MPALTLIANEIFDIASQVQLLSADSDLKVETNEDGACTETAGWPDQDESRLLKWKKALQGERNLRQMLLVNREILRNLQNKRAEDMVARRQLRK